MTDRPAPPGPPEPDDRTIELASRYLDDDLTVDERAAAAADPATMAWVVRLGGVREALGAPIEVSSAHREDAVAAALAAAVTPVADRPTSVVRAPVVDELAAARSRRNGRVAKWLGAAAAAVALGVAGVTIAGNRDRGTDSSSEDVELAAASASTAAAATTGAAASARDGSGTDEQAGADTQLSSSAGAAPEAASPSSPALAATTAASPATTTAGGSSDTDADATETTSAAADTTAAPAATSSVAGDPDTPLALADEAALRAYATTAGASPPGSSAPCLSAEPGETLLSRNASYAGTAVVVYRNDRDHTVSVYEIVDCTLLAFVQLPTE